VSVTTNANVQTLRFLFNIKLDQLCPTLGPRPNAAQSEVLCGPV